MMLKLKRVYDPPSKDDGKRILVDRLWPRGLRKSAADVDEWMKEIAPSDELRKWFAHDPEKWPDFRKKYKEELRAKPELVKKLKAEASNQTITILFSAKDIEHNNAVVLKEVIG